MVNILVTGATRGIGRAIANELKSVGNVYGSGRNAKLLEGYEKYCVCDLANGTDALENFIREHEIDVLVNNAGEYVYGGIDEMTHEQIEHIMNVNLISAIKLSSVATKYMKEKSWGRIINIGSISGVMGEAYASLYSATKSGMVGFSKALALELAEYNITVNTINPGWVDTELGNNSIESSDFSKEEIIQTIPQRRFVQPQEIAQLVKYLISDSAKGITGQSINVCAGLSVGI